MDRRLLCATIVFFLWIMEVFLIRPSRNSCNGDHQIWTSTLTPDGKDEYYHPVNQPSLCLDAGDSASKYEFSSSEINVLSPLDYRA